MIERNHACLARSSCDIQGIALPRLRTQAREALLREAQHYTREYRDVDASGRQADLLLLAGHQPRLFHPGVWLKNFALSALAQRVGGQAINLVVDNDILRQNAILVPADEPSGPRVVPVPYDRAVEKIPFEQRDVVDEGLFNSFSDRVKTLGGSALDEPLIEDYWKLVLAARQQSANVGHAFAQARHQLEGRWGQNTWEIPLSVVCRTSAFARFASHLLAHLPRFREVHNTALREYRRVNHVRSRAHPVPDLERDGQWHEAPFWLWTDASPSRKRAFARQTGSNVEVTDRADVRVQLPLTPEADGGRAADALAALSLRGVKLRPRALITTMYARLLLSNMFMHGIGGAKYDQLTDLIIGRFFGLTPPGFVVLSATVLLFEDRTAELASQIRDAKRRLRELRFQPERHLPTDFESNGWIAEKQAWIARQPPRGQRRERHIQIERLNRLLGASLESDRRQTFENIAHLTDELRRQTSLASREFSFCLFSEKKLRPLLLALCGGTV